MSLTHLNPSGLHTNPAFSQGVRIDGGNLVVVGGQNGTDSIGDVVSNDLGEQTTQAFRNVLAVLAEAGADQPSRSATEHLPTSRRRRDRRLPGRGRGLGPASHRHHRVAGVSLRPP